MKRSIEIENDNIEKIDDPIGRRIILRTSFMPLLSCPAGPTYEIYQPLLQPFKPPTFLKSKRPRRVNAGEPELNYSPEYLTPVLRTSYQPAGWLGLNGNFTMPKTSLLRNLMSAEPMVKQVDQEVYKEDEEEEIIYDPLVLWKKGRDKIPPYEGLNADDLVDEVICPALIGKYLREHQRDGMKFLFKCAIGLTENLGEDPESRLEGCILADDMGLGKTIQSIALLYTLMATSLFRSGENKGKPIIKKALVICPTSLVKNWENELQKWLQGKVKALGVSESGRKEVIKCIKKFTNPSRISYGAEAPKDYQVLVISYDTFRIHQRLFKNNKHLCELMICDEAHRLKNGESKISKALNTIETKRRLLLTGTPIQNELEEFYSLVSFSNPGVLGDVNKFRRKYVNPIAIGREFDSTEGEKTRMKNLSIELSNIVNKFILKRINTINIKYLPPKLTQVVCIKMTESQKLLYKKILTDKSIVNLTDSNKTSNVALRSINVLKQIANSAEIIEKENLANIRRGADADKFNLQSVFDSLSEAVRAEGYSSKFALIIDLLQKIRSEALPDKFVIVSNYTKTLALLSEHLKKHGFVHVRLDGSVSGKRRAEMVEELNAKHSKLDAFLLSSKAGGRCSLYFILGCGLNLIGANRLILLDPDWNPAVDLQAVFFLFHLVQAARVWREGQKHMCYIYRFFSTRTIEEKIFQRQLSKNALQSVVEYNADSDNNLDSFSSKDLKDIFSLELFESHSLSDTHDKLNCSKCKLVQEGYPDSEDLVNWTHWDNIDDGKDELLKSSDIAKKYVSFIFAQRIDADGAEILNAAPQRSEFQAAENIADEDQSTQDDATTLTAETSLEEIQQDTDSVVALSVSDEGEKGLMPVSKSGESAQLTSDPTNEKVVDLTV
eukprot:maker-scaffold_15-snap-gene-10.75-mRNA-1 protein AED:0.08 eAED:0.10 QI:0/0/0/1/1/1/2/0/893